MAPSRTIRVGVFRSLPFAAAAAAAMLGAVLASGCNRTQTPPAISSAGPEMRVLLTSSPVEAAEVSATAGCTIILDGRTIVDRSGRMKVRQIARNGPDWQVGKLSAGGRELSIVAAPRGLVRLGRTYYRGSLRFIPAGRRGFNIVNHVNVDAYVAGVLAKELYDDWSGQTYRALAVAARTYGLHRRATSADRSYDVMSGQADQVYGGYSAETDKSQRAVLATLGWVLAHGPAGDERIFLSQYSACNGGYVNPASVLRQAPEIEPLAGGQADPDGRRCPRYAWPAVVLAKTDIYQAVCDQYESANSLGGLATIKIIKQTDYGRPLWLDLVGPTGRAVRLRAEDLRIALLRAGLAEAKGLYSMNCRIRDLGDSIEFYDGRGFGHGVGLSQWGAQDKALRGWPAERILAFYYPGANIFRAY